MFKRVLIANRGEIALRALRTCKELGIETVLIYSEADKNSLPVMLSDEAVCVGPPEPQRSYLNIPQIMAVAELKKVDALYPGYGFLAENPKFARIVKESGIKFIGPPAEVLELIGDKVRARKVAKELGIPTVPGSDRPVSFEEALEVAREIGYPIVLKSAGGGGGRGIRIIRDERELREKFSIAVSESEAFFKDPRLYIEKYIINPKHIEVQILCDYFGNVVSLGERECSIQRRHQKVIEEAPSCALDEEMRKRVEGYAVKFVKEIGFVGAGTVEFLLDDEGNFYFIEMNGRIQVEHPVSEVITGVDIVKWQFLIEGGEKLKVKPKREGVALEMRINAEDPETFKPSPGKVERLVLPGGFGVRVDSHLYQGYEVPPYYDSLLAKVIVWAQNRQELITRALRALEETLIEGQGLKTNREFLRRVLNSKEFKEGKHHTHFVEELLI